MSSLLLLVLLGTTPPTPDIKPLEAGATAAQAKEAALRAAADEPSKKPDAKGEVKPEGKVAEKPEAKAGEKPEEKPAAPATAARPAPAPVPPSLSAGALTDELKQAAASQKGARAQLEQERKALAAERAKLESTAAEIARAREQLRAETARLEALIKQAETVGAVPRLASAPAAANTDAPNLVAVMKAAKSMKPPQAASMLARMEPQLAAQVLQRMSPKDSGAVLAAMKPEQAADLMGLLAALPALPAAKGRKL